MAFKYMLDWIDFTCLQVHSKIYVTTIFQARLEETRLTKSLEFWQVQLHYDLQNKTNKSTINDPRSQLQISTYRKEGRHKIWSKTKWMKLRDWMNKYLFSLVKESVLREASLLNFVMMKPMLSPQVRTLQGCVMHFTLSCTLSQYRMGNEKIVE